MTSHPARPSVFGNVSLGYLVIDTDRFTDWRRFGEDAIGMHTDRPDADHLRFRVDDHACRFLLQRPPRRAAGPRRTGDTPAEDVTAMGWQVHDHTSFDTLEARVLDAGIPATEGTPDEAALRGVERLLRFPGPKHITQELFTTPVTTDEPLQLRASGFVTGRAGMGHVALTSRKPEQVRGYFTHLLDARLSDYIDETISGVKLKIRFLRVNQRHHSVAIASTQTPVRLNPIRTRVQHLNVQVAELDDMVNAYQRIRALGFGMALSVGQHTNDRELSFYCVTPSGFEWEVGWNPLEFDAEREETWKPCTYRGISIWGHTPMGQTVVDKLDQFATGARSLLTPEPTVEALAGAGIPDDDQPAIWAPTTDQPAVTPQKVAALKENRP